MDGAIKRFKSALTVYAEPYINQKTINEYEVSLLIRYYKKRLLTAQTHTADHFFKTDHRTHPSFLQGNSR